MCHDGLRDREPKELSSCANPLAVLSREPLVCLGQDTRPPTTTIDHSPVRIARMRALFNTADWAKARRLVTLFPVLFPASDPFDDPQLHQA